jgi:hypothetical protein
MRGRFVQQRRNDLEESEEPRFVVVKKIRDAILEETFKLGERLSLRAELSSARSDHALGTFFLR